MSFSKSVRNAYFYLACVVLLGGTLLFQLILQRGADSHVEANCFLILYNFTSNWFKTIFDPLRTDWNLYQARELSYFIDFLDARFIGWCIKHKMAHFYSLSAILSAIGVLVIQQWGFARGFPKINCWCTLALSLLWQWTPCNFIHHFFRCGKPVTSLLITMLLFSFRVIWKNGKNEKTAQVLFFTAVVLLPFFDRQGIFLLAAATVFFALLRSVASDGYQRSFLKIAAIAGAASIAVQTLFNVFITPATVNALNGYTPSFEYQKMPLSAVFDFNGTIYFLFDNIGFWFLGFDNGGVLIMCAVGIIFWQLWRKKRWDIQLLFAFCLAVLAAMANLMMFRHRLLIIDGVNHSAYFMPFAAVLMIVIAIIVETFEWKKIVFLMCVSVLVSQTFATVLSKKDPVHNRFHRHSSSAILKVLNDEKINPRRVLMPYSAWKVVDAFRGNLRGWEFGGIPVKYPKD